MIPILVYTDMGSLIGNLQCINFRIVLSSTQNLREINFDHFEAPKTNILIIWAALNLEFLESFDIFKCEIFPKSKFKALNIVETTGFDLV